MMRLLSIIIIEKTERDGENCDKTQEVGRSEEETEMVRLHCVTKHRRWEGLTRKLRW
jgi:hypothetical protein